MQRRARDEPRQVNLNEVRVKVLAIAMNRPPAPPPPPGAGGGAAGGGGNVVNDLALALQAVLQGFQQQQAANVAANNERVNRKPPTYESGKPLDWLTFVRNFELTATINHWPNNRARRELAAAMTGPAARAVAHIPVEVVAGQPQIDYPALMVAYAAVFMPEAESDLAVALFEKCRQWADEEILVWHSRCRDLFIRAYPGEATETSRRLIAAYSQGLADAKIKDFIFTHRPLTYALALAGAQNRQASLHCMVDMGPAPTEAEGVSKSKMNAMGHDLMVGAMAHKQGGGPTCWYCQKPGHMRRKCPALIKSAKTLGIDISEAIARAAEGGKKNGGENKKKFKKWGKKGGKKDKDVNAIGEGGDDGDSSAPENQ